MEENPVENATVTMFVQGRTVNLTAGEQKNTYTATTQITEAGSYNIYLVVEKEDYYTEVVSFTVEVLPLLTTFCSLLLLSRLDAINLFVENAGFTFPLMGVGLIAGLVGVLWSISPKSRRMQTYWGGLWYLKLLLSASCGVISVMLLTTFLGGAQLDLGLLKPTLTTPIATAIGVIVSALVLALSLSYTPRVKRMAVGTIISWGMLGLFILFFTQSAGVVTNCIAAGMVSVTAVGYLKRPHLRERLMKSLVTSLVLWSVGIFLLILWSNMLMTPYFTQGEIINSLVATSMGGYFVLWQLYMLVFIPVGHIWYTINQVSKTEKIDAEKLLASMVNRTQWIK
jgi:hypothetical protein